MVAEGLNPQRHTRTHVCGLDGHERDGSCGQCVAMGWEARVDSHTFTTTTTLVVVVAESCRWLVEIVVDAVVVMVIDLVLMK